jgi:Lon protease-like protein
MTQTVKIPLFVLPAGIFPTVEEPLRVFEPRYKQMLDDCVLDGKPFGYITHSNDVSDVNGWTQPGIYGVLCDVKNVEEQGTNLLFTANGTSRFEIIDVVQAALPSMPFGDIFPTVDELVEQYHESSPEGKLYLQANVRIVEEIEGEISAEDWSAFLHSWAQHIVDVNSILRNDDLGIEDMLLLLEEEFLPYDSPSLWQVAHAVLDDAADRQQALRSKDCHEVFKTLQDALKMKNAQLNFIRTLNEHDD